MDLIAYPVRMKQKSRDVLAAFVHGFGGQLSLDGKYQEGRPAAFWGVDGTNEEAWRQARAASPQVPFYYGDNAYFDACRGTYFRFTKNALQHHGCGFSTGERLGRAGVHIAEDWAGEGEHIILVEQSPTFMRDLALQPDGWAKRITEMIRAFSKREIRLRPWNPDKIKLGKTLPQDLAGAHALVTWSSAAGVEAVLAGVPVFSEPQSATGSMGYWAVDRIEEPYRPKREDVRRWAQVLADNQWTVEELRAGLPRERLEMPS